PTRLGALDRGRGVSSRLVERQGFVGDGEHLVGAEGAEVPLAGGTDQQRVHRRAGRVRQLAGGGQRLERNSPHFASTLFENRENAGHQMTFASLRSASISAGTAPGPSPRMRPSFRAGGRESSRTPTPPESAATAFTSSGFFFAAMMPLSAGYRGSFNPLSAVSTAGSV